MAFVADFRTPFQCLAESPVERLGGRLREILALLRAIEVGELLSELPANPTARESHSVGLSLLEVMSRELASLIAELDELGAAAERPEFVN